MAGAMVSAAVQLKGSNGNKVTLTPAVVDHIVATLAVQAPTILLAATRPGAP